MEESHINRDGIVDERPMPIDLSHHYSFATKSRQMSSLKGFYKYFKIPGIGNLAGGLPNNNYFPFDTLEANAAHPHRWTPTPNKPVDPPSEQLAEASLTEQKKIKHDQLRVVVPKASDNENLIRKIDIKSALQYGQAQGYPPLYDFLLHFTRENMHPNIPYKDGPEIVLTCGNTDGFSKTLEALTNVWSEERNPISEKEGLLVEEYAYMGAIQTARPRGMNIVPVAVDEEGMCAQGPGGLLDVLENWDPTRGQRPHLIYTVTIGQNPTSGVLSLTRRRAIYALCVKYDVIIVEDDPYWYLQYPSANALSLQHRGRPISQNSARPGDPYWSHHNPSFHNNKWHPPPPAASSWKSSGYAFLDSLVPSYLSIDTQGRVVRLDTFSKTIAPGCRLGWITTQPALAERLLRITETSTQQPSGFVQSIVAELILGPSDSDPPSHKNRHQNPSWQSAGWVRWLEGLRGNYERRMQTMSSIFTEGAQLVQTADAHTNDDDDAVVVSKTPMYTFTPPLGGMFIWLQINLPSHPLYPSCSLSSSLNPSSSSSDDDDNNHTPAKLAEALWIHLTTPPYLVLVCPGTVFAANDQIKDERAWQFFRICFAAVDEAEVGGMSRRFVEGVRKFWEVREWGVVEGLLVQAEGDRDGVERGVVDGLVDLRGVC